MNNPKSRILVFIPAYRCERQIKRVIEQFDQETQSYIDTVIVVDNRSPDGTLQAAIDAAQGVFKQTHFIAWLNDDNYGLGGSHKAAFNYAIQNKFDFLIVLHGDDQADIRDIIPLLKNGSHLNVDCMLGARFMSGSRLGGYSKFRTFGNKAYNTLFAMVLIKRVYDLGSGLNLYRTYAYKDFYFKGFPDDLTFNYVMLLASFQRKQKVEFFPISWREEDQRSNVKLFQQAFRVLGLLVRFLVGQGAFLKTDMRTKPFEIYSGTIKAQIGQKS